MHRLNVEDTLLKVLEEREDQLDHEIEQMNKMTEEDFIEMRRKRLEAMKSAHNQRKQLTSNGHGSYSEIHDEREFFEVGKKSKLVVVHFYRPSNWRCEIIDKHLMELSRKHVAIRFVKINAEKVHFLCDRLKIWCLPTLVLIKDGRTEHSIVGFDEFGGDDFATSVMEDRLAAHGLIERED